MTSKICVKCGIEKRIDDFYGRRDSTMASRSWCKRCLLDFQTQRWQSRKRKAVELMGGKCMECGYSKNLSALQFHHVDPSQKEYTIHSLMQKAWINIVEELKKCILLCANCHAEKHNPQMVFDLISEHDANRRLNATNKTISQCYQQGLSSTGLCPICNTETYGTIFCSRKCASQSQRKVERPSWEELSLQMQSSSIYSIAKRYGVSDNAIRKWVRGYQKKHGP